MTEDEMPFEYEQDMNIMRCLALIAIVCIVMAIGLTAGIVLSWIFEL